MAISNFYENIYHTLTRNPGEVFIVWPRRGLPPERFTGKTVLDLVSFYQGVLKNKKIGEGDMVLLAMPLSFNLICGLLAVMASGAIPVLPPAGATPKSLLHLVRKGPVKGVLVLGSGNFLQKLILKCLGSKLISLQDPGSHSGPWESPHMVNPLQPALVTHSSGSTGLYKTIRRSHQVLQAQHQALKVAFPSFSGQKDFPLFPNILLHNLTVGTRSIIPDLLGFDLLKMKPALLLQQIQDEQISTLTGNVFYFRKLLNDLERNPVEFPAVRQLGIGGSPVPEMVLKGLRKFFINTTIYVIYGSIEAEPIAIREVKGEQDPSIGYGVGKFHPSLQWRIKEIGFLSVKGKKYSAGEIEVKGAHVAVPAGEWLRTGDFGYVNEEEKLFLTGRRGNEKICSGVQHYQAEHILQHLEGVEKVAAIAGKNGFVVYLQGSASVEMAWAALDNVFPEGTVSEIHKRENIPTDARHHSKILYRKVS